MLSLPNLLTLSRILAVPLLVALLWDAGWLGLVRGGLHAAPPLAAQWGRVQYRKVPRSTGMD
jgi:phosphatidylglycerophosphate synthase